MANLIALIVIIIAFLSVMSNLGFSLDSIVGEISYRFSTLGSDNVAIILALAIVAIIIYAFHKKA